jgi:hypothetical protein
MGFKYVVEAGPSREASGAVPSASAIYRNVVAKDGFPTSDVATLHELMDHATKKFADQPCLGRRPKSADGTVGDFEFITYAQTGEQIAAVASGLAGLGLAAGSRVGVFGTNCPEWMVAMQVRGRARLGAEMGGGSRWAPERHDGNACPLPRRPAAACPSSACRCTTRWARTPSSTS